MTKFKTVNEYISESFSVQLDEMSREEYMARHRQIFNRLPRRIVFGNKGYRHWKMVHHAIYDHIMKHFS